jgi:hypothetical protein
MKTKREAFIAALSDTIEQAPDECKQTLFKTFTEYAEVRTHVRRRIPIVQMLFEAIEEGLWEEFMAREIELAEKELEEKEEMVK